MVGKLKTFATKRNLTILMVAYFVLGIIGSIIYFTWLDNYNISEWFGQPYVILSTITHLLGYVAPVILLASIISMDKESSEKIFAGAIITGLAISIFSSFIVPALTSSTISGGNLIGNIILKIPAVFIIIDIYRKHKLTHVSCILCVVMAALQLLSSLINIVEAVRYGGNYAPAIMPTITGVLYWIILLLYLSRFIKLKNTKTEETIGYDACTAEQRLITLKKQYDNGEITIEEYNEIKRIILQSYIDK